MMMTILSFVLAYVLTNESAQKVTAFDILGKNKPTLEQDNPTLIYNFKTGYLKPDWSSGTENAPCRLVDITYTSENPEFKRDSLYYSALIHAPAGKWKYYGKRKDVVTEQDEFIYSLTTSEGLRYGVYIESLVDKSVGRITIIMEVK